MMPFLNEFLLRCKSLLHKRRSDREMAEELDFHQSLMREKLSRQGVPRFEIDATIRRTFGNPARWHERLRELWQFRSVENLMRDVGFSFRMLRKSPGFTSIALLTLALGVGANTAVFSLINALLLRPLPVPDAQQLAVLRMEDGGPNPNYSFITPFLRSLEPRPDLFDHVFAYDTETIQVRGAVGSENVHGALVSGQFFPALETSPLLGRYLTAEDDKPGGRTEGSAVVISESFWKTWFNRAPDVVGRKLVIANTPFTVVGVMPRAFIGADPTQRPDVFAPLSAEPVIDAPRHNLDEGTHAWWLTVMVRMRPGMTLDQANAALLTVSTQILHETGDAEFIADEEHGHFHFSAESGSRGFTYARIVFRKPLVAMFAMCGGILLLACLNLTSLLMARGSARERELATRLAMGATRGRLIHQLLVESLLIAVIGTGLGLVTAPLVGRSLGAMLLSGAGDNRIQIDTSLDFRVFLFAALIAITAAVLIGLVPALRSTGRDLNQHIKEGQHASNLQERAKVLPRILMALEVALALVLVAGAALLATSLFKLYQSGAGFDPKGVVNVAFSMDKQPLEGDALFQVYHQIGDELRRQPGVKSESFSFIVPLSHLGWNGIFKGTAPKPAVMWMNAVAPKYFETMRIPMFSGRDIDWNDTSASGKKIILNESAAKLYFPDREAIGEQLLDPRTKQSFEVIAVVGDTKYKDMRTPAGAVGFVPIQQDEQKKPSFTAVLRVEGGQGQLAPLAAASRAIAARLAPTIPAPILTTMSEVMDNAMGAERMMAVLGIFFAGCALLVTAIGLYGTLSYATARRTSEIGIRMVLGARRAGVVLLVFRENAVVAAIGSICGLIVAIFASRALASFLYETSPRDPWILIASVTALATIASAASLLPAIRAAQIEPITAIRRE
jgi:putative ABC transport system permease protein